MLDDDDAVRTTDSHRCSTTPVRLFHRCSSQGLRMRLGHTRHLALRALTALDCDVWRTSELFTALGDNSPRRSKPQRVQLSVFRRVFFSLVDKSQTHTAFPWTIDCAKFVSQPSMILIWPAPAIICSSVAQTSRYPIAGRLGGTSVMSPDETALRSALAENHVSDHVISTLVELTGLIHICISQVNL